MIKTEQFENLQDRFPTISGFIGKTEANSAFRNLIANGLPWVALHQIELDLQYLARYLDIQLLRKAYAKDLRDTNQIREAMYEIYTASLLASVAEEIRLKVPTKGEKDCDFRVKMKGCDVYGEVKTRRDKFPFNTVPQKDTLGESLYAASRTIVDPHIAESSDTPQVDIAIPESTELRQRIENALGQLPDDCSNLVVLGLIGPFHFPQEIRQHIESALFGDSFMCLRQGSKNAILERYQNGVFGDDRYGGQITLVTWLALNPSTHGVIRRSGIYFNPEANYPLPREVELILEGLFDRTKVLQKELERIVEKIKRVYSPERIILFGSLAQDRVKEGSDIDLAIVKDTDKRPLDRCLEIANICQPSVAVNFIVYTPEEIKRAEKSGNFFVVEEILKKGQVLYER